MKNLNTRQSNTQINIIKNLLILVVILIIIPIGGCDQEQNKVLEQGFLRGDISIGPLCPVETIPPNPNCQPTEATYSEYNTFSTLHYLKQSPLDQMKLLSSIYILIRELDKRISYSDN
jgi:hypothetical protein